ncbi:hypothetical protein FB192DRAFT_1352289 [Mucor lusitanicus]|uniref:Uncharacterized protein n=1 Tax=Mucor circinelloides f. lusitanicus TaxID=29924 RepID=A0A8H4F6H6_MUCCL|nr:hypothetical protein FB192DRAFT_1352289 [Mucor lusitanicus]
MLTTSLTSTTIRSSPSCPVKSPCSTLNFKTSPWEPRYCTWLVFMNSKWVPFDTPNQYKLDHTLSLQGTFVDIQDSHFPSVKKVRVFPKSNHLSYLGLKYRISKVMQTDVWRFP